MQESTIKLSLLMPVRNDGASIRVVLRVIEAIVTLPHEVLVIYDFSDDTTVPVVRKLQQQYRNVHLIHNTFGKGVSNALRAGVGHARGKYIAICTADEIIPSLTITDMVTLMDAGCEFVSATRYAHGGRRYGGSRIQFVFSWIGNKIFQLLSGSVLTDCTTGYKAFKKSIFEKIAIDSQAFSWSVAFELAVKAQIARLKLGEVPIISIDRLYGGQSSFSLWRWLKEYFVWFLWGIWELRSAKNRQKNVMRLTKSMNQNQETGPATMNKQKEISQNHSLLGRVTRCQICQEGNLVPVLSLGHHPPAHSHLTRETLHQPETTYPLALCRCTACGLVQLDYIAPPEIVFYPDYPYQTGMTQMLIRNFQSLAAKLADSYNLKERDLVVDIGSNDGSLLRCFKDKGFNVVGIEPTNVAKIAIENGIPTLQEFFNEHTARAIRNEHGPAAVITATNVFAHIADVFEVMRGVDFLLSDDGVFVSESQYLVDILQKLEFDTIYHEHLRYYSLKPLIELFRMADFTVVDAERIEAAGGSIRVYAMKGRRSASERVAALLAEEENAGIYKEETFREFARRVAIAKQELLELLLECKKKGGLIVGIGAPCRSNSLLNFVKIASDIVEYAAERSGSPKIGLFSPGAHIPIYDEERIFSDQPQYALILSWHIGDELMRIFRNKGFRGKFIMPLPRPRLLE